MRRLTGVIAAAHPGAAGLAGRRAAFAHRRALGLEAEPLLVQSRTFERDWPGSSSCRKRAAQGQTWEGIWRLDGERQLTIVDDAPNPSKGRPVDFTTAIDSGEVMIVFRR
jgi:hypothetical protein